MKALLLLFALVVTPVCAQTLPYGQYSDLKGLKKVYVDTGADTKSRDSIIKALDKSKFGFEVVDGMEEADIGLVFGAGTTLHSIIATANGGVATARAIEDGTGDGWVIARARGKTRLILSFSDVQTTWLERKPVTNFVREFIKVYKQGNSIK